MNIKQMIKAIGKPRTAIAQQAGISLYQLNNYVSQGREVLELADGGYVLITDKTKIFKEVDTNANERL